jgi:hypothetical protein
MKNQSGFSRRSSLGVFATTPLGGAAEGVGRVECYVIEQEGSRYPEFKAAKLCLSNDRRLSG